MRACGAFQSQIGRSSWPRTAGKQGFNMGYKTNNNGWHKLHDTNIIVVETGPNPFQNTKPSNMRDVRGIKSVRMAFLGDTANDDFTVAVYGVDAIGGPDREATDKQYKSELLYTIRVVVGAGAGIGPVDTRHVGLLYLYADTITSNTAATIVTDLALYWNIDGVGPTAQILSPTGDGYAEVLLGSTFGYTWFSFITTVMDVGNSANVLYKLDAI